MKKSCSSGVFMKISQNFAENYPEKLLWTIAFNSFMKEVPIPIPMIRTYVMKELKTSLVNIVKPLDIWESVYIHQEYYKTPYSLKKMIKKNVKISSVNMKKSAKNYGLGHIYWCNP